MGTHIKFVTLPSSPSKITRVVELKTPVSNAITTINRGMLGRTRKELEFRLDVSVTRGAHIEVQ
jgi:pSer/pThr/pTyr-binding forkhead associated (FHA) protein